MRFVLRTTGRQPLDAPGSVADLTRYPAAAVELDGGLWVAAMDPDSDGGRMLLFRSPASGVVKLA